MRKYIDGYKLVGKYRNTNSIKVFSTGGSYSDPVLRYAGYYFNYWDIENAVFDMFVEDNGGYNNPLTEKELVERFDTCESWTGDLLESYLNDCIYGGYKYRSISELVKSY